MADVVGDDRPLGAADRKAAALAAALDAADAKLATNSSLALKLDAKRARFVGVAVQLQLNGRLNAPAAGGGRRLRQYTLPQPPPASLTPPRSAAMLDSDAWTPWLVRLCVGGRGGRGRGAGFRWPALPHRTNTPPPPFFSLSQSYVDGPDVVYDARLVPTSAVRSAMLALVAARFARDGVAAARVAAVAVPVDPARGLYDVRVGWRGGGDASVGVALAAVNDVPPGGACAAWRADHDVCGELLAASPLDVVAVQARAHTAPPGAISAGMSLGRRSRGLGVPASIGAPRVGVVDDDNQFVRSFDMGKLKDIYWFLDKSFEGKSKRGRRGVGGGVGGRRCREWWGTAARLPTTLCLSSSSQATPTGWGRQIAGKPLPKD